MLRPVGPAENPAPVPGRALIGAGDQLTAALGRLRQECEQVGRVLPGHLRALGGATC